MSKRAEERAQAYENGLDYYHYTGDNPSVAYKAGYEQAEKDIGWQSAKDSKPNPSEWVVVCIEQHGTPQCLALATYNEELGKWFTDFEDGEQEEYHPDYWLRIPELEGQK